MNDAEYVYTIWILALSGLGSKSFINSSKYFNLPMYLIDYLVTSICILQVDLCVNQLKAYCYCMILKDE